MSSNIKIGPYIMLETLGVGSFGKVKRAVHSLTGHTVAIKIINKNKVVNQDMFARVRREIQYLKLLRHPHIIKLYEVISTPTSIYMVIEYAGGELFNYIVDKTKLSEDEARRFFQQIVCAIEYCHRHKIVHRDLKPENLLLDPSMNVKIADFGLSNIMTDGDFLKTSCGSPNYAAPEVISGKLYAGPEVDVWSCGVILYVMLCGRLPFDDDRIPILFKKINGGIYSLPSFLSPETKYLLTSMLVVDPLKRITIAEIRQNAWFNVGLPEYLKPLPQGVNDDSFCDMQEDIIDELMKKMNFSKDTIVQALQERQNNQIKVAYQLVVDHRQMIENASQMSPQKPFQSFLATSPPPWNTSDSNGALSPNIKSVTGSSAGSALKSASGTGTERGDASSSDNDSMDSPVPSSITVLSTSLPGNSLAKELHRKASLRNTRRDRAFSQPHSPHSSHYNQSGSPTTNSSGSTSVSPFGHHSTEHGPTTAFHQAAVLGNSGPGAGIPFQAARTSLYPSYTSGVNSINSNTSGSSNHNNNNNNNNNNSNSSNSNNNNTSMSTSSSTAAAAAAQRRIKARPKWYFGIRSRSAPLEVMAEIYRALSNLSMKWKIINAYHLRAKYEYAEGFEVKIELQLYRLDSENYLVDFKYVGQHSAAETQARAELLRSINEASLVTAAAAAAAASTSTTPTGTSPGPITTTSTTRTRTRTAEASPSLSPSSSSSSSSPLSSPTETQSDESLAVTPSFLTTKAKGVVRVSDPKDIPHFLGGVPSSESLDLPLSSTMPALQPKVDLVGLGRPTSVVPPSKSKSTSTTTTTTTTIVTPTSDPMSLTPVMSLSMSLPTNVTATGSRALSSSVMQEKQHLKDIDELRQELRHHQRQRDLNQRPTHLLFPKASYQLASPKEVTSPFPFFDVCGKLITELAIGSG